MTVRETQHALNCGEPVEYRGGKYHVVEIIYSVGPDGGIVIKVSLSKRRGMYVKDCRPGQLKRLLEAG